MPSSLHNLFQIDWWDDNEQRIANAHGKGASRVNKGTEESTKLLNHEIEAPGSKPGLDLRSQYTYVLVDGN
jgi:hypothetical protein